MALKDALSNIWYEWSLSLPMLCCSVVRAISFSSMLGPDASLYLYIDCYRWITYIYIYTVLVSPLLKSAMKNNSRQWQRRPTSSWINAWPLPSKEARHDSARWAAGESQRPTVAGTQALLGGFWGSQRICLKILVTVKNISRKNMGTLHGILNIFSGWNYKLSFAFSQMKFYLSVAKQGSTKMTPKSTNKLSSSNLTLFQMYQ